MRLAITTLALTLAASTPALANDVRVEVRGGAGWANGAQADTTIGGAAGYDWSLAGAFVGVEQSADKVLASGNKVRWGTSGRIGAALVPGTRLYATAGYNYGVGPNGSDIGAGLEHDFGPVYGKAEYKHFFNEGGLSNSNAALIGVGLRF